MVGKILEGTFVAILVYLVVANAEGFSQAVGALSAGYANSVRALQAR